MTYQEQQNSLLQLYLDKTKKDESVEFIFSSLCNQACEYCYLYRHGKEMYPPEANDKDNILHNLPILLKWLEDEGYVYETYDIFSGEFFNLSYWEDILQIFYEHQHSDDSIPVRGFVIPTNMSFLMDEKRTERVVHWIKKIDDDNRFTRIWLSASVDGPYELEKTERALRNATTKDDDNFYDKFFSFLAEYEYSPHPMVTKNFVKNYKENYDWWIDNLIKYNVRFNKFGHEQVQAIPMFLEVRNQEQWDEESLKNYHDFLLYIAEKDLHSLHGDDMQDFMRHFFDDFSNHMADVGTLNHVQPYILAYPSIQNRLTCAIQQHLMIRVGDLGITPCHRTCYPDKMLGFLTLDEAKEQIIGLNATNPTLALKIRTLNPNRSMLKCSNCKIKAFCLKGCLGAQYEATGELFCAIEEVCNLMFVKYKTIHEIAQKYDLYKMMERDLEIPKERKEVIQYARSILEQLD